MVLVFGIGDVMLFRDDLVGVGFVMLAEGCLVLANEGSVVFRIFVWLVDGMSGVFVGRLEFVLPFWAFAEGRTYLTISAATVSFAIYLRVFLQCKASSLR